MPRMYHPVLDRHRDVDERAVPEHRAVGWRPADDEPEPQPAADVGAEEPGADEPAAADPPKRSRSRRDTDTDHTEQEG